MRYPSCKEVSEREQETTREMTEPEYKRYMLFSHDWYYPAGGTGDCRNSFDTLEEAINGVKEDPDRVFDECYIFDRIDGKIVWDQDEIV